MKPTKTIFALCTLCLLFTSFRLLNDWILYQTKHCSIYFPSKPSFETEDMNSAVGKLKIDMYMYEVPDSVADDNHLYALYETEYPENSISSDRKEKQDDFFRGAIDGSAKNVNGKILSEKKIELEGYPGHEVRIDFKDGLAVIRMRYYLVKNRLFMLQIFTETKKEQNKSIDRFMDSFKLKQ